MAKTNFFIEITTKGLRGAAKGFKALKNTMGAVVSAGTKVAKGTALVGTALGSAGLKAVHMAGEFKKVEQGFLALNESAGFGAGALQKYQSALDGTVSKQDIMTMSNNAMLLGIANSEDEMARLFDTAQRLASAVGEDAAFGVDSLVTGMGRQSKLMLDNLGIMVDTNKAYEDYAKELNKSTNELTDSERKTAFNNAALAEAERLVGKLGDEQLTTADKMTAMKVSFIDTATEIGTKLTPAFNNVLDTVSNLGTKISGSLMKALDLDFGTTGKNILLNMEKLGNALVDSMVVIFDSSTFKNIFGGLLVGLGFVMVQAAEAIKNVAIFLFEPIIVMGKQMGIKIANFFIDAVNTMVETVNMLPGIEFELFPKLSEEGLSFAETRMGEFFNKVGDDETNSNKQVADKLKGIWSNYSKGIITFNEAIEESEDASLNVKNKQVKTQGDLTEQVKETKQKTLEGSLATIQTAEDGLRVIRSTIKGYFAEMVAGMLKEEIGSKGLAGLVTGAIGAAGAALLFEDVVPKFAQGGDFVTNGPQMIMVGDNAGGRERVQVTPLSSPNINGPQGAINISFTGNVMSQDFIESEAIPMIKQAIRRGADIGVS
tara:strand:- start:2743 stop:4545 length:1803 start_codon:yes stop_codon:yes gene_type:complete